MSEGKTERLSFKEVIALKVSDYMQLTKFRLSMLVIFSSVIGYLIAAEGNFSWAQLSLLILGGFLTTAAANTLNQVIEKDFDRLMPRTMNRPLPHERMTNTEALLAAGIMGVSGILIFALYFNDMSAIFSALALLSYACIYTPLKRYTSFAVFVGAIPGALPPLIGWVSATGGSISSMAIALFMIQFLWQFPHFWAIAWVAWDDYLKAGFRLLPSREGRNSFSAIQTVLYIVALIPMSLVPFYFGFTGWISAVIIAACGVAFLYQAINLVRECSIPAARKLMFGSFFYLPIVQLALFFDRV